ncbi:CFEM domain-containing protein [Aspergillus unguis]
MDLSGMGLSASDLASMDIPTCALKCLFEAVSQSSCQLTDFGCICADAALNAQLQPCVLATCSVKESLTAKNFTTTTCGLPTSNDTTVFPITNIVGIVVAILSVAMRLVYRSIDKQLGWDDFTIVLSLLFAAAVSGIGIKLKDYGLGRDIWTVPFDDIRQTLKLFFIEEELYCICIALVKVSMLILYLRLFPNKRLRIAVYATMVATALWGIIAFFVLLFSCKPISYYWNEWDGEHKGTCLSHNNILLAHSTINIVLDVIIVCLPMPVLLKLQMPIGKRLGIISMFAVGIAVTVISIMRLVETVGFNSTENPTKDFVPVGIWSLLEFDVAIMCACMPAFRALFIRFYGRVFRSNVDSRGYTIGSDRFKYKSNSKGSSFPSSGSRNQYSANVTSKAHQDTNHAQEEFIRLEEIDTEDDRDRWAVQNTQGVAGASRSHSAARLVRKESN